MSNTPADTDRPGATRPWRVLVVDDDDEVRSGLRSFLRAKGLEVEEARDCAAADQALASARPDAILLDEVLPDGSGLELLRRAKKAAADVPVVMLTGHGSIEMAVRAIKLGAEQFLTKPVDLAAVFALLTRCLDGSRNRQRRLAHDTTRQREAVDPFAGSSRAIRTLAAEAERILETSRPVLLLGETGTGKGVLARWIHDQGPRRQDAFVDVNCAGLSPELLASELFGHEPGAFTGANRSKPGLLEVAHRGTVFLDEIGDMDGSIQGKLLKVLEERRFRRLGDVRERLVDIRLVAATHRDLPALCREGRFRADLYYRLAALPLSVPPLRERAEDIPRLAAEITGRFAAELGRHGVALSQEAVAALQRHAWPGNLRELRNTIERAVLLTEEDILRPGHLRFFDGGTASADSATATLEEIERAHIERVLALEEGHVGRTASRLGISTSSLYVRLRRYRIGRFER